ncbi:MAG TPA: nickel pincer cofactor biosynthesis protein LarC [Candidatus Binatia bacterium]
MTVLYLDAFSGISGDMTIGALLDLGLPLEVLEKGLAPLGVSGYRLEVGKRVRSGITATKFTVHLEGADGDPGLFPHAPSRHAHHHHGHPHDHEHTHEHHHAHEHHHHGEREHARKPDEHARRRGEHAQHAHGDAGHGHRHYREIRELLERTALTPRVRERAQRIFHALAVAEARVHGVTPDDVAFHEVGAIDAIVDVVGTALGLEHFGVEEVLVSSLPLGSGLTRSQHGVIPVPPPATVELLRGFPVRPEDGTHELVTPTGAAIVAALAKPARGTEIVPRAIGWGAGERELPDRPNLLRVVLGERAARSTGAAIAHSGAGTTLEEMVVVEANVDDMNPELFEPAVEALFAAGARDVTLAPITMKKGRPATLVQVICEPAARERIAGVLLRETTTIGVRMHAVERIVLPREQRTVTTPFGAIRVKVATLPDGSQRATPEYDDCRRAALEHGVPVGRVYAAALAAASA